MTGSARAVAFQTQRALEEEKPLDYLKDALDEPVAKDLVKLLGNDKNAMRHFLDVVHRDNDVTRWAGFVEHEQKRAESGWKDLESLPQRLRDWRNSLDTDEPRDNVVCAVQRELRNIVADLADKERVRIGLRAFRAMVWRLRSGGGEQ